MDEETRQSALMSALTTEHFVLQTAVSSTIAEASSRSSLYVLALSSSLVAMGFTSQSPTLFLPFVVSVLPAVFLLGLFTVVRLVGTWLECMQYLSGIARIRSHYRSLGPEAETYFAPDKGRWPEAQSTAALRLGPMFAYLGTTASMIAFINNIVAGACATMLTNALLDRNHAWLALPIGITSAVLLSVAFLAYQRRRFSLFYGASADNGEPRRQS